MIRPYLMPVVYITTKCNLSCKYCYVKKTGRTMNWETAKKAIDFLASLDYKRRVVSLFGGEPLVEWELVKRMVEYIESTGKFTDIFLCTNGTLLDEEKLEFFAAHKMTPQISIDGIRKAQDSSRIDEKNRGSFALLDRNLRILGEKYITQIPNLQLRLTITPKTIPYLHETLKYIIKLNLSRAQINFMPEPHSEFSETEFSEMRKQFIKIARLTAELQKKDRKLNINYNECIVQGSDFSAMLKPDWSPFCSLGSQMLSIDVNGIVYPCYIAAGISERKREKLEMGNIYDGIEFPKKVEGVDYSKASNPCLSCLAWNYEITGKMLKPAEPYKVMYAAWKEAMEVYKDEA